MMYKKLNEKLFMQIIYSILRLCMHTHASSVLLSLTYPDYITMMVDKIFHETGKANRVFIYHHILNRISSCT